METATHEKLPNPLAYYLYVKKTYVQDVTMVIYTLYIGILPKAVFLLIKYTQEQKI